MNQKLSTYKFEDVRMGSVFYDPKTGQRYQKVDQPVHGGRNKYGNYYNGWGNQQKQFQPNDEVEWTR